MPLTLLEVSPRDPRAQALLRDSQALMAALFPPEENHALDLSGLEMPCVSLFAAEQDGQLLGCVALKRHDGFAEVKSMFVASEARGIGVARRLLRHVECVARGEGIARLRLETGPQLSAAIQLYEASGFREIGPFGEYRDALSSVFYEKALVVGAA